MLLRYKWLTQRRLHSSRNCSYLKTENCRRLELVLARLISSLIPLPLKTMNSSYLVYLEFCSSSSVAIFTSFSLYNLWNLKRHIYLWSYDVIITWHHNMTKMISLLWFIAWAQVTFCLFSPKDKKFHHRIKNTITS